MGYGTIVDTTHIHTQTLAILICKFLLGVGKMANSQLAVIPNGITYKHVYLFKSKVDYHWKIT